MKKTTRKSFSRKAIVAVMSVFLTVSLTAVGFASWLISNNDSKKGTGNVTASDVSDAILGVTIENAENLGKINFGPDKNDKTGTIRYNEAETDDFEALKITVSGSIDKYKTLDKMSITVKCPDSILTAAGYTWTGADGARAYTYDKTKAYIALPGCAVDKDGKFLPMIDSANNTKADEYPSGDKIFTGSDDNKKEFTVTISFGWGELFQKENPGIYLDKDKESIKNLTDLLNIANAENTAANYTELTAEAKRDILTAMKNAIAASEAKFTVVVNAQAK
ncbi:MAG: hypothetical protein KH405_03705 [Firmicutes bacterium]|nr:hypothetical protein [Bacillota bacterium]